MTEVKCDFCTACRKQTEYTLQKRNITKIMIIFEPLKGK